MAMTDHDVQVELSANTDQSDIGSMGPGLALDALRSAPADWRKVVEALPPDHVGALDRQARAIAVRAAMLAEYAAARSEPDQGHDAGVGFAKRIYTGVRSLLGFSYPDRGAFNF